MDKVTELIILYDFYSELLTEKQRDYFIYYYFNNLSLGEISENLKVSRNAVHKQLRVIESKLLTYEEKLKLYEKSKKIDNIIDTIKDKELKEKLKEINLI
ncbi:MAG: sigma factor-like helix-turn-helix DNA-binding protein [Bacilli bacterium]|nr:sigma factor-like helix-turn-helix DNA-binding protein [Bacilli bacterium]